MPILLPFTKMEGLGNDFVVIDDLSPVQPLDRAKVGPIDSELARRLCDRATAVGADQLLHLKPPQGEANDAFMGVINADGSIAEMCGNGIRAIGLYLYYRGPNPGRGLYNVETLAGTKSLMIRPPGLVTVDMGAPVLGGGFDKLTGMANLGEYIRVDEAFKGSSVTPLQTVAFHEVSMGNPHAVILVPSLYHYPAEQIGPYLETHPRFPNRTNVEFVEVMDPHKIRVRVWERGAGFTRACGTGACAAAVAALAARKVSGEVEVELPGGKLHVSWFGPDQSVMMEGPASEIYRGAFDIESGQIRRT